MTALVLHLREFAKTKRIKQGPSFSTVIVRKAIMEEIAMILKTANMVGILAKMVERVKIYLGLSNALVKMNL